MNPSVSPEADRELTEGGVFYAREGGGELGLAFIAEFERSLNFLCLHPHIGALWRNDRREPIGAASHCDGFPIASSTTYATMNFVSWLSPITGRGQVTGRVVRGPGRRWKN